MFMWVKISANIKIEYLLLFIKLVFLHLTILFMLTKRLSANKNNHHCSPLHYKNVTAAHLCHRQK